MNTEFYWNILIKHTFLKSVSFLNTDLTKVCGHCMMSLVRRSYDKIITGRASRILGKQEQEWEPPRFHVNHYNTVWAKPVPCTILFTYSYCATHYQISGYVYIVILTLYYKSKHTLLNAWWWSHQGHFQWM